jgi:hypothetical protein
LPAGFLREGYSLQILVRSIANEETVHDYVVSLQSQTGLLGGDSRAGEGRENKIVS